jgi:hypothetical protein
MLFLSTNILHIRERICLIKKIFFPKDMGFTSYNRYGFILQIDCDFLSCYRLFVSICWFCTIKNCHFVNLDNSFTNILHIRERICLIKKIFFPKDMANYTIFILVPNMYNPILNIKVVMSV